MIWKTTLAFFVDKASLFFTKNNYAPTSTFFNAQSILLIFFGFILSISNGHSQVFIPDGNYNASEYTGAVVSNLDLSASGTCEVKQIYSVVKSDANGPYLLLGFYNGNAGKAIFRYYFDTNPMLDLVSEEYKNIVYQLPGADVVLQVDTNDSSTLVYKYDGSNLVLNNTSGLIAKVGDFKLSDKKFIEIKVPLTGTGSVIDLCDLAEGGIINLGSYISFSGGSLNAAACDSQNIGLDINVTGTISGGKSYCSGSPNSTPLTLTGNFGAVKIWQKNNGSGWSDIPNTANTSTYVASNVSVTTSYRAVIVNNTCPDKEVETGMATITINTSPAAPVAGSVTQPTCEVATGTFQISAYDAANTYNFTPAVVSISDSGLVTANAGTYSFTVTNAAGCASEASADIVVNEQLETPAAPVAGSVTQPTCDVATGTFQISAYDAANSYTFTPAVVSISETGLVTANAGTYSFTVTNAQGCTSEASENIVVKEQLETPAAPVAGSVTQPTCDVTTGTFQINAYNAANTYNFTPDVVNISDSGLVTANAGTYSFTVTNAEGCTSEASENIVVNEQLETPAAPVAGSVTQPTCDVATETFQITGFDAANTYNFTPGVVSISDSGLVTANAGTYNFTVTNAAGCTSEASADIVVNEQLETPAAPVAGSVTQPTCEVGTGTFQITGYDATNIYNFTPGVVGISETGLVTANTGTYSFTVTNTAGCTSEASENIVVNEQLETPAAPVAGSVTQPTCEVATGNFQIAEYNAANTYNFTPAVVSVSDLGLVTANAGTYNFTVTNAEGCTSEASADIVVNEQLETPATPVAGSVTQPTCDVATGTFQIRAYDAANSYNFTPAVVSVSDSGLVTANAGTYNFKVTNAEGCTSEASADIVVNEQLETPAAPVAGSVTQPTCEVATGTFQITGYNSANTYNFTPDVVNISDSGLVTANAGTYSFTVTNAEGCTSEASADIVVNEQLETPAAPVAGSVTQPTCEVATGSFQITEFNSANSYNFTPAVVSISETGLVTANAGTYSFTVTNTAGCTSEASADIVVNEQLETPAAPVAGSVTQPTCEVATGTFQITGYNAANTYTFTPGVVGISDSGLVTANAGTYSFTVTNAAGCTSEASADIVVNEQLETPAAPVAGSVTQPTCEVATGSFQITEYDAANTYNFTPAVVSISDSGLVTANAGIYNFTVTNAAGCTSEASADIVVNEQLETPAAPVAGSVTQPTCEVATGTFQIAEYNAANTYNFTPGVVSISDSGLVTANAGIYSFTVTNAAGCTSEASENIVVNEQLETPAAPVAGSVTQPTCDVATGTFQIAGYNSANSYNFTPAVASISDSGLVTANAGTYNFTVTNAQGCTSEASADIVVNEQLETPAAPVAGSVTQPTCEVATGTFQITEYDAANTYNFTPAVVRLSETGLVTANAGTYNFTVTSSEGCTSEASADVVVNEQLETPAAPVAGSVSQPTCNVATGTFQITGFDAANTYNFTPGVVSISETGLVTANAGTYFFTVTNTAGCTSEASENIVVNEQLETPAAPVAGSVTQPTCEVATGTFQISAYDAANSYNFTPAVVSISETGLVTANAGTYSFTVTNAEGCTSEASENIVVNEQLETPAAPVAGSVTQPTCEVATGTFQISEYNAANTYNFTPAVVSISETGLVTANAGTYSFMVTNAEGCTSEASADIVVNEQLETPAAPVAGSVTQPTCDVATGTFQITAFDAASTYNFTPAVVSISETGLVTANAGTYSFTVTNAEGCTSEASADIVVNEQLETPAAPVAGSVTQPTCDVATGTFQITAFDAAITYNFTPAVVSVSDSGLVTANAGTYSFTITNAEGCTSEASENILVNEQLETPAAPVAGSVTQPTCEVATGTFQISEYDAANTYNFTPAVVSVSDSGLVTANAGTYSFTITNAEGCTSEASENILVNEQLETPAAPVAGSVTQPTCEVATGTFQTSEYNAANTYNFTPAVVSISETGLVTANAGTYSFTVTNAEGCTSEASADIVVNEQLETPAAPVAGSVTQPTCDVATGTFQITAFDAANTYNFNPGVVSISETGLVTANAGTYNFTVTNAEGCTSEASADIVVNEQLETPAAPVAGTVTQPTCEVATGTFQITAYDAANSYNFTPAVVSVSDSGLVTVNAGTYNFTVTNTVGCTSESTSVTINAQPATPSSPVVVSSTQPTCETATGSFSVTAVSGLEYSFNGENFGSSISFTDLAPGTYTVIARNAAGCESEATSVTINAQPATPASPVVVSTTQPTCETATGSFNVTAVSGLTYSFNGGNFGSSVSFIDLAPGTYSVIARNAAGCESEAASVTINAQPATPASPVVASTTQPTCETATGSFSITPDRELTLSFNGGNFGSSVSFTDLNPGTYTVVARNAAGCESEATSVTINAQPATPASPVVVSTTQPTCETATGSFNVTAVSGLEYSINGSNFGSSVSFTDLSPGTYTVVARNAAGCESEATSVTINAQPATPASPIVVSSTQPTCETATGSFSVTAVSGLEYSFNGGDFGSATSFADLNPGTYTVVARNAAGCESEATSVTINAQPATPASPVVVSTTQPTCETATGSFNVTAVSGLTYSFNGGNFGSSISFIDLAPGTYTVIARNAAGCESEAASVTINAQPTTLATPVVASITQPDCEVTTGSFNITAVSGLTYSFNGGDFGSTTSFEDLVSGTYTITARNEAGCESETVSVTIEEAQVNVVVADPSFICDDGGVYNLNSLISGGENAVSGIWVDTDQTGALNNGVIDPTATAPGFYTFTYVIEGNCPLTTDVTIEIRDCVVGPCELSDIKNSVSKAVTPNGDGFNDFLTIGIDLACEFTYAVKIFNRWGAEIFKDNNYNNNWDGYSNKSVTSSNQLPSGTYYYILEVTDEDGNRLEPIQGYIYLGTK